MKWSSCVKNNSDVQPLVYAIDGGLHVVEVFGQAMNGVLQLPDLLCVSWTKGKKDVKCAA